ncbi:MAG: dynamin family protein [Saprospiraceae bacterium]|nr:dynamin family protein [Candidatus Vicinibacter affinis]
MSQSALIEKDLQGPYLLFEEIAKDLHALTISIDNQSLVDTVSDLRNRIRDPFMFVIVGEVKVGKSSFINALLQTTTEICKVAPSPMTDTIQQIVYGPEYMEIAISPVLKRITYPEEILKEIAIVDTPGTNTIIQHHQEITEKFIPVSDLVLFVFEAKNPYRQSAWDLFTYIKEDWRKKIIFVLQQKDLMSENDLLVNINGLRQFAIQKGIEEPMIFPVSAKMELEGQTESSGFNGLRNFIKENITGGKAAFLKLLNNIDNCNNISQKLQSGIQLRKDQYDYDVEFRDDISKTLKEHERISFNNVNLLIENLVAAYQTSSSS